MKKKLKKLKSQAVDVKQILSESHDFIRDGVHGRLVLADIDVDDRQMLRGISDQLRHRLGSGVVVVIGKGEGSHPIIINVSQDLTTFFHAGNLLKEMVAQMGGKGGGRSDSAQGAAPNRNRLEAAFQVLKTEIIG